ncbi:MAG: flippase [Spirochaetia bacterium]|nr:flippase [Spirochaetia bacterium]
MSQILTLVFGKIFGAVAGIALVRYLGAELQGVYSYIFSIVFLLSFITDFGLSALLVREIKIAGDSSGKFLGNAVMLQVFQILVSAVLIILYSVFFEKNPAAKSSLLPASFAITLVYLANPFIASLTSHEKMYLSGIAGGLASFFNAVFISISIFLGLKLPGIILMLGISNMLNIAVSSSLCVKYAVKPEFKFDPVLIKNMIKMSFPFAVMGLFNFMYEKINVLILFYMKDPVEVGYYTGAARLIEILNAFVVAIMAPVYPRLSMIINTGSKENAIKVINLSVKYIAFAVAPCALFVSVLGADWTLLLLGEKFAPSAPVLSLLIWTIFLLSIHVIPGYALNAARLTKLVTTVYGINILINLGLNFTLIPRYGYIATAAIAVVCNIFALIMLVFFTHQRIGKTELPKYLLKISLSLLPALGTLVLLHNRINYIILSVLSLAVFAATGFMLKYFDRQDYELFRRIFSGALGFIGKKMHGTSK